MSTVILTNGGVIAIGMDSLKDIQQHWDEMGMGGWEWRLWWWQCFIASFLSCYVSDTLRWPLSFISLEPLLIGIVHRCLCFTAGNLCRSSPHLERRKGKMGMRRNSWGRQEKGESKRQRSKKRHRMERIRCLISFFSTRKKRQGDRRKGRTK